MGEARHLPRARPLGLGRLSPLDLELNRLELAADGLAARPIAIKVWNGSPRTLRDLEIAVGAAGGELRRPPVSVAGEAALVLLPSDAHPGDLPPPLDAALKALSRATAEPTPPLRCGARTLTFERTRTMAIINLTDDSFSGDGLGRDVDAAVRRAADAVRSGADIVDVGGESARADVPIRDEQEEIDRIAPAIERIAAEIDVVVSVDTWKPAVAEAAIGAGARLVNDIGGMKLGAGMAKVAALHGVPLVLNHTRMRPKVRPPAPPVYDDVLDEVYAFLEDRIAEATAHGVVEDQIVVDPGVAFGKSHDDDLEVVRRLGELRALGRPILLAHSRKHFVGSALGGLPPGERLEGTVAATALAVAAGADIVRVHDVEATVRAIRLADALVRAKRGAFASSPESWPYPSER